MLNDMMPAYRERRAAQEVSDMQRLALAVIRILASFTAFIVGYVLICAGLGI